MKNSYFFSQVHHIFFTLSFINAVLYMGLFAVGFSGFIEFSVDITLFHIISMIYFIFTPAFIGFLFTTFPRFLSLPPIDIKIYTNLFFIFIASTLLNILGALFSETIFKISLILLFIGVSLVVFILYRLHTGSTISIKDDTKFILIGFSFAPISLIFFIFELNHIAVEVAIYNFLFVVSFSVAQRMVPFFSNVYPQKDSKFLLSVVVLLVIKTILESIFSGLSFFINFILAGIIAKEILRWQLPNARNFAMLYILHIALLWIPMAFLIGGISEAMKLFFAVETLALDIHILMLGFLFTILIGFGTRVTIGHSRNQIRDTKFIKALFVSTQIVVLSRVLVSIANIFDYDYSLLFYISVTLWIGLFLAWVFKFIKLFFIKGVKI